MSRDDYLPPSLGGEESDGTSEVSTEAIFDSVLGAPAILRIISGPEEGVAIELQDLPVTVGRSGSAADIAVNDPGMSKQHFMISRHGKHLVVQDVGSSNGTLVNGKRIQRVQVRLGDTVAAGASLMRFVAAGQGSVAKGDDLPVLRNTRSRSSTVVGGADDDVVIELVDRVDEGDREE